MFASISVHVGPTSSECGNGIIESGEDCDCGSKNMTECAMVDRCCTVNCTLVPVANCRYVYAGFVHVLILGDSKGTRKN